MRDLRGLVSKDSKLQGLDKILGFFSYEFSQALRSSEYKASQKILPSPLAYWVFYKNFLRLKKTNNKWHVDQVVWDFQAPKSTASADVVKSSVKWQTFSEQVESSIDYITYEKKIAQIRRDIRQGNYYQANFTFYLRRQKPRKAFAYLWDFYKKNPAAHYVYMQIPGLQILSTSPETFFTRNAEQVQVFPIKGTLAKPGKPADLIASEKNSAELAMIVDLFRNDLHKICGLTTVRVNQHKAILEMQNLYHLYSEVAGDLKKQISLYEIFAALFPSGSITGCPKIRSQQAITALEDIERGVYTGSLGYLSHEEARLSVAIRTMHIYKEYMYYQVGGGIVWDSEAESEWQECFAKAQMFLQKDT